MLSCRFHCYFSIHHPGYSDLATLAGLDPSRRRRPCPSLIPLFTPSFFSAVQPCHLCLLDPPISDHVFLLVWCPKWPPLACQGQLSRLARTGHGVPAA